MTMREMKIYNDASWNDCDDIARKIRELSNAPTESIEALTDAIYQLKAMAQNEYNNDYWRVLYNALDMIADTTA